MPRAKKSATLPVPTAAASEDFRDGDGVDYNPLPTDVIEDPPAASFDSASLVTTLADIPLESLSYEDCGAILNALSAASTKVALTRRERQEQLAAGTHRAPCATCKRPIDISKPGGYQILTVRDEHYQPANVYFCSQNCLLGRNMPSHRTKKLPGDVGGPAA